MSKPLLLRKAGSRWNLLLDVDAATRASRRYRSKRPEDHAPGSLIPLARRGDGKLGLVPGGKPAALTKKEAEGFAHQIGRYMLDLGDFVYTYVEEERESVSRDDARVPIGTVLINRSGEEIFVKRTHDDPGREPLIELVNRDRGTRSFMTKKELAWMLETGNLRRTSSRSSRDTTRRPRRGEPARHRPAQPAAEYEQLVSSYLWRRTELGASQVERAMNRHSALIENNRRKRVRATETARAILRRERRAS